MTTRVAALAQPQAIKGLGGIGKTQIAIEYAYRYRDDYSCTLWINAATEETLISSFGMIASLLPSFPAKDEIEQKKLVEAVKRWLEQRGKRWLLIFDNADDLALDYFPLALDQAAAYIEETQCRLSDYLQLYQTRRKNSSQGAAFRSPTILTQWRRPGRFRFKGLSGRTLLLPNSCTCVPSWPPMLSRKHCSGKALPIGIPASNRLPPIHWHSIR